MNRPLPPLTLILGGQRSGKSAYAERLFAAGGVYLATGHATDPEMAERIEAHQGRRGEGWITVEEPTDLSTAFKRVGDLYGPKPVLLDSVGMWVANMLHAGLSPVVEAEAVADVLAAHKGPVVAVSDEVGLGTVPMNEVARSFVDSLGLTNQILAERADRVVLVSAGLPLMLKEDSPQ